MLGIRFFNGVAIDLFQGAMNEFVCDAMVQPDVNFSAGETATTTAGEFPARWLIKVGALENADAVGVEALLKSSYSNCLLAVQELNARHLAIPALSAPQGFTLKSASLLAMRTVKECLGDKGRLGRITFVLPDQMHYSAYRDALFATFEET
ncbi:MAG: macro domain-containing protein [Oligoflexales bacterium]